MKQIFQINLIKGQRRFAVFRFLLHLSHKSIIMDKKDNTAQLKLFAKIKLIEKGNKKWVAKLGELLDVKIAVMYRKVSGAVRISLTEFFFLCRHYNIEPYKLEDDLNSAVFDIPLMSTGDGAEKTGRDSYLMAVRDNLVAVSQMRDPLLWISSYELPLVYEYPFKELTAFKNYMNNLANWSWDQTRPDKYANEKQVPSPEIQKIMDEALDAYLTIPSIEFWNPHQMQITLHQIGYALQAGLFRDAQEANMILNQLEEYIDYIEQVCFQGKKTKFGEPQIMDSCASVSMYYNEISHTNNIIYIETREKDIVYMTIDSPNFIYSGGKTVNNLVKNWFGKLKRNSSHIGTSSHRNRQVFISQQHNLLRAKRKELESFLR